MMPARRVRFGVAVGRGTSGEILQQARMAEAFGFDSVWMMDHLNGFPTHKIVFDPFTMLGALSRECRRVILGCAVTDPFRRHPALLAQAMGTLAHLASRPVVLVIGGGEAMNLVPFGFVRDRPLAHMRESLEVVRKLLDSSVDNVVDHDGLFYRLSSAFLQLQPMDQVLLYVAASGPRALRLAGELGDGWVSLMLTPQQLAEDCGILNLAAATAGRDPLAVDVSHHIDIGLARDARAAVSLVGQSARKLLLGFPHAAARLNCSLPEGLSWMHLTVDRDTERAVTEAAERVPDSLVAATSIVGTEDECIRRIDEYIEAGVTHFVFRPGNDLEHLGRFVKNSVRPRYASRLIV